jgi:hypothetical protein
MGAWDDLSVSLETGWLNFKTAYIELLEMVFVHNKTQGDAHNNHHSNTKNLRRINVLVTAQTTYNLDKLAGMCGYKNAGRVIDKLVREKMMELNEYRAMDGAAR